MRQNGFIKTFVLTLAVLHTLSFSTIGEEKPKSGTPKDSDEKTVASGVVSDRDLLKHPNHRRFNVRIAAGANFALGDSLEKKKLGEYGAQGGIGVDWTIVGPLAFSILVGYNAFSTGDNGALQDLFATVGLRLRLFTDQMGSAKEPGGNPWGHLFIDGHFGYHGYENQEHAGYNVGLGYEFSIARDFNLGPYARLSHTPIGDGFSYLSFAFGIQASVGGKFSPDDADKDGIEDHEDSCPLAVEDKDEFEDEDGCPDSDNDKDGIADANDKCPNIAGVSSNQGCEEIDNDHDGILNDDDACPEEPEDKDKYEDEDGCPDLDNDQDDIEDNKDKCPLGPEDKDGFEDEDGCPDEDNDQDKILDARDSCPQIPETVNQVNDDDGCPDYVQVKDTELTLIQPIVFKKKNTEIADESTPVIQEIAALLKLMQETKLRIEGHTDNRAPKKQAQKVSQTQADTVKSALVKEGIDAARLTALGVGPEKPIGDNGTKEGRAKNNRIELHIEKVEDVKTEDTDAKPKEKEENTPKTPQESSDKTPAEVKNK